MKLKRIRYRLIKAGVPEASITLAPEGTVLTVPSEVRFWKDGSIDVLPNCRPEILEVIGRLSRGLSGFTTVSDYADGITLWTWQHDKSVQFKPGASKEQLEAVKEYVEELLNAIN